MLIGFMFILVSLIEAKDEIANTFRLIDAGDELIKFDDHKFVVLILGNTGSGKSTLTQFLAGDNNKLIAKEVFANSGEYLITDGNRIGDSTINSKTIYPELAIENGTNLALIDCPGFSDTRNSSIDIASSFFIKKIADSIDGAKIVFTVSYPSVRKGVDRKDFLTLLIHATTLIKDVKKFEDAIMLIVTKVDNEFKKVDGNFVLVPDEVIVSKIVDFLLSVKEDLQGRSNGEINANKLNFLENAIDLVQAFLKNTEGKYEKIGLFRRPDQSGPLSEIATLQEGRVKLLKMIDAAPYIALQKDDFGYSISDKSMVDIYDLVNVINKEITSSVNDITTDIEDYYKHKYRSPDDFISTEEELKKDISDWKQNIANFSDGEIPKTFLKKIVLELRKKRIDVSKEQVLNIVKHSKYFDFLEIVSNKKLESHSSKWYYSLKQLVDYLSGDYDQIEFLIDLYDELSDYNVQKDRETIRTNLPKEIDGNNFKASLKTLKNYKVIDTSIHHNESVNFFQLLNEILKATLRSEISSTCPGGGKLTIQGDYIRINDIKDTCSYTVKSIEIFALNTVFVDRDFRTKIDLCIISPRWKIVGERTIVLNGNDGETFPKAATSRKYGQIGKSGMQGEDAGNFFGIGSEFIDGKNLKIFANGGDGGPGQDGGDGMDGYNGRDPSLPRDAYHAFGLSYPERYDYQYQGESGSYMCGYLFVCWKRYYVVEGGDGGRGFHGGDGGVGGVGGSGGSVQLIEMDDKSAIYIENRSGKLGTGGKGGQGGQGGRNGDKWKVTGEFSRQPLTLFIWATENWSREWVYYRGYARSGVRGQDGSTHSVSKRESIRSADHSKIASAITNYKLHLHSNLPKNNVLKHTLETFVKKIQDNSRIKQMYDTFSFIEELKMLENHFYQLKATKQLLPLYQNLLERIDTYKSTLDKGTKEEKSTLDYLHLTTLSKICTLKSAFEKNLIIDLHGYLQSVKDNIDHLQTVERNTNIHQESVKYSEKIDAKIREAKTFVKEQIVQKIDSINSEIDRYVQYLLNDITKAKLDEIDNHRLIEQRIEFEESLKSKGIATFLKRLGRIVMFFTDYGSVVLNVFDALKPDANLVIAPEETADKETLMTLIDTVQDDVELIGAENLHKELEEFKVNVDQASPNDTNSLIERFIYKLNDDRFVNNNGTDLVIKNLRSLLHLFSEGGDFGAFFTSKDKVKRLKESLVNIDDKIDRLNDYKKMIDNVTLPFIVYMHENLGNLTDSIQEKSIVASMIDKWQTQTMLKQLKFIVNDFRAGFKMEEAILRCVENLDEVMSTLINVYIEIQNYREKKEFSTFVENVLAADSRTIAYGRYDHARSELERFLRSNLIIDQYEKASSAFKQWVFPFANLYLEDVALMNDGDQNLIDNVIARIDKIKSKVDEYTHSIVKGHDDQIHTEIYDSDTTSSKPFYVWKSIEHEKDIFELLNGKVVSFKSDVTKADNKNAVKFNRIEINMRTFDKKDQDELNSILKNFRIRMLHSGNNYYRCYRSFYLITSDSQLISFTFEKTQIGDPVSSNSVYRKLKEGNFLLSPFTTWNFQLVNTTNVDFSLLRPFYRKIDLELIGHGQFVNDTEICNTKLHNYYRRDDSILEINNIYIDVDSV